LLSQITIAKSHYAELVESQTASEEAKRISTQSVRCQTDPVQLKFVTNARVDNIANASCQTESDDFETRSVSPPTQPTRSNTQKRPRSAAALSILCDDLEYAYPQVP